LLVENYQLTARIGLRIGTEFLANPSTSCCLFIMFCAQERGLGEESEGLLLLRGCGWTWTRGRRCGAWKATSRSRCNTQGSVLSYLSACSSWWCILRRAGLWWRKQAGV